jgi:hypothetical protein
LGREFGLSVFVGRNLVSGDRDNQKAIYDKKEKDEVYGEFLVAFRRRSSEVLFDWVELGKLDIEYTSLDWRRNFTKHDHYDQHDSKSTSNSSIESQSHSILDMFVDEEDHHS